MSLNGEQCPKPSTSSTGSHARLPEMVTEKDPFNFDVGEQIDRDDVNSKEVNGRNHKRSRESYRNRLKRWKRTLTRTACASVPHVDADGESVVDGGDDGGDFPERVASFDNLSVLSRTLLPQGRVSFWREFEYEPEGHPYVRLSHDVQMEDVDRILQYEWKMAIPTIVLEVVSSVGRSVFWEGHRQWANLKEGLIQAANKTDMWIITHGLNTGVAKMLGDIVQKENQRRQAMTCYRHPKQSGPKLPKLTLMGIVNSDLLNYDERLDGKSSRVEVDNNGNHPKERKYDLNPNHSHFLLVKDTKPDASGLKSFILRMAHYLKCNADVDVSFGGVPLRDETDKPSLGSSDIPLIVLLIGGGNKSTVMVLDHLKKRIPVVVVKGSGGASDLLAFAYEEIKEQSRGDWDPDYIETFIMSEISRKIAVQFEEYRDNNLARNKFRDRILECVRHSTMDDRVFLTFVDIHSHYVDLSSLNQYLLRALFKAEKRNIADHNWYYHLQKDLRLTLDWNVPHIALSEVFDKNAGKVRIEKKVFEQALLRQNREAFIELFLDQGFQIHKFLTGKRLSKLFEKAENPEFFRTVCLECALGYSFSLKLNKQFLKRDLSWMITYLTKLNNFIQVHDLTSNAMGTYTTEPPIAERRALHALVIWAVLMNRSQLAKVLWRRCDYPIHLALIVSLLYSKLVTYVKEKHLSKELDERSKEFANMSIGVLDASFQASNCRAFDILSEEVPDWDFKTAVEIAAIARNRKFIAHPCCQKWLTYLFYGEIRIRELKFGPVTVPPAMKVILSAFFILPMYIWIHFKTGQKRSIIGIYDDDHDSDENSDNDSEVDTVSQPPLSRMCSREGRNNSFPMAVINNAVNGEIEVKYEELPSTTQSKKTRSWRLHRFPQVTFMQYLKPKPQPPFWRKMHVMWNCPITKFWGHQIFYIFYLALFSLTVLWPSYGNFYLDCALWIWTALIFAENARITYYQYKKYASIPLGSRTFELTAIFIFLFMFLVVRILRRNDKTPFDLDVSNDYFSPYSARVIMCLGLLYFFYRFIWIYFPISPTLGPLLYRIRLMVTDDFVHFLRLAVIFIISSGIVIHSVIYPDYPISKELLRRVFHKAWFTLFLTPINDLEEDERCSGLFRNATIYPNSIGKYEDYTCPNTGAWAYIMTIQYHIILKLILLTLLYALFRETRARMVAAQKASGDTAANTASDADAIWRYQRYHLVLDFSARLRLPAPLSIFSYLIKLFEAICKGITCKYCEKSNTDALESAEIAKHLRQKANDYKYWRTLARDYSREQDDKDKEKKFAYRQMESLKGLEESVEFQKSSLYKLKVRLTELEKIMLTSKISLEEIKHGINNDESDVKMSAGSMHLLSRHSPYPESRVQRFPLADKYVPWEVQYSVYDPVVYSRPRVEFPNRIRDFVDEDLLLMREQQGDIFHAPSLKWNINITSGAGVNVDRESWIIRHESENKSNKGERIIYKLDCAGLPVNPMGRTGLRGRGSLFRWGPNHSIFLIITRWRLRDGFLQSVQGTMSEEHKILEFVFYREPGERTLSFPGGFIHGESSAYNVIRKLFCPDQKELWNLEKMKQYFSAFACSKSGDFVDIVGKETEEYNIDTTLMFRDYLDDTRNTDNAWIEAEVWHLHYTDNQSVKIDQLPEMRWKKITSNLRAKMLPSHASLLTEVQQRLESN